jgi:hypothetical protein
LHQKIVSAKSEGAERRYSLNTDQASLQVPANRNTIIGLMALRLSPKR